MSRSDEVNKDMALGECPGEWCYVGSSSSYDNIMEVDKKWLI